MDGWDGIGIKWMVIVGSLRARSVLVKLKLGFLTREESLYLSALACSSKIVVFVFSEHVDRLSWSRNGNISMIIVKISEYIDDHGQNIGNKEQQNWAKRAR